MEMAEKKPIDRAVEAVGGQAGLARVCSVTPQAVMQWVSKGKPPAGRVLQIEEATGVSRHELRPDVFGPQPDAPVAPAVAS